MFTLIDSIVLAVIAAFMIGFGVHVLNDNYWYDKKKKIAVIVVEILVMVAIAGGCALYNTHTESGKRNIKTWKSESTGGLNRTVIVYDIEGDEIARYTGKFDVEEHAENGVVKVKFDDNGKRHIIYAQTGTVLIDEN